MITRKRLMYRGKLVQFIVDDMGDIVPKGHVSIRYRQQIVLLPLVKGRKIYRCFIKKGALAGI